MKQFRLKSQEREILLYMRFRGATHANIHRRHHGGDVSGRPRGEAASKPQDFRPSESSRSASPPLHRDASLLRRPGRLHSRTLRGHLQRRKRKRRAAIW